MQSPFTLDNKTIIITGASSGIGQQTAITCSQMGAKIVMIARNEERLEETRRHLDGEGHLVISYDLTDLEHQRQLVSDIVAKTGPINGLVNCAGISTVLPLKLMSPDQVNHFFLTNVYAPTELTRQILKMGNVCKEGASIIFFASVMGVVGETAKSLYSMTKGALISGARSLALEYAKRYIRVNVVSPGVVVTPINMHQPYIADPEKRAILEANHPLGLGSTTDVANACVYLLSDASKWMTGQNLIIDGGYTIK